MSLLLGPLAYGISGVGGGLFWIYLFLNEGLLLYSIMLDSNKRQQESAIDLPIPLPYEHPSQLSAHPPF